MTKEFCIVITTTDSEETAMLLARTLITSKLAACVQLDKIKSVFSYENSLKQSDEMRLFIKAKAENYKAIEEAIQLNHNYQLPQIVKLDITDGSSEYLEWIRQY